MADAATALRPRRRKVRTAVAIPAYAYPGGAPVPCAVTDISQSGARLEFGVDVPECSRLALFIGAAHPMLDCEIVWRKENRAGVRFVT